MDFSCAFSVDKESKTKSSAERSSEVQLSLRGQEPVRLIAADCVIVHPFFVEMLEADDFVRF